MYKARSLISLACIAYLVVRGRIVLDLLEDQKGVLKNKIKIKLKLI